MRLRDIFFTAKHYTSYDDFKSHIDKAIFDIPLTAVSDKEYYLTNKEDIYELIKEELSRAKKIHPNYPVDRFIQFTIMQEEAGEVAKAVYDYYHENKGSLEDIKTELIQTAAMCVRMLETIK